MYFENKMTPLSWYDNSPNNSVESIDFISLSFSSNNDENDFHHHYFEDPMLEEKLKDFESNKTSKSQNSITHEEKIYLDDSEFLDGWPIYLGSFLLGVSLKDAYKYEQSDFKIETDPLNDYITKSSKNIYKHYISATSPHIYNKKTKIKTFYHLLDGIWQFLLIFKLVELKPSLIDREHFKISVYLTKKTSLKNFDITKELLFQNNFIPNRGVYDEKAQDIRLHELIKYCKESIIILFDLIKVKKNLDSLIPLKKIKAMKSKKFISPFWNNQEYPSIYVESYAMTKYYQRGNFHSDFANYQSYLICNNCKFQLFYDFSKKTNFEDDKEKEGEINEIKNTNEFLHYLNSNKFKFHNTPKGMKTPLHKYQMQALSWCLYREQFIDESNLYKEKNDIENFRKLNFFCEEYELLDKGNIYLNILTGEISLEKQTNKFCRGGILADEMGLGKTLIALALIHETKDSCYDKEEESDYFSITSKENPNKKRKVIKIKEKTLIVTPMTILDQWKKEIINHSKEDSLKVLTFYGNSRKNLKFDDYDIILTTYDVVSSEYKNVVDKSNQSKIFSIKWFRIILDEAHNIKNFRSKRAEACYNLQAVNRWCLTGTPIQNNLDDLYSLLKFLGTEYFAEDYSLWNTYIKNERNQRDILKHMVGPMLLRRTKQTLDEDGNPYVKLAGKTINIIKIQMGKDEKEVYDELFNQSKNKFKILLRNGVALQNYSGIFSMLIKLRQCCDHPSLILKKVENQDIEERLKEFLLKQPKYESDDDEIRLNTILYAEKTTIPTISTELFEEVAQRIKTEDFAECAICLSDMIEPTLSKCCHILCFECFKHSIDINNQCPFCRQTLAIQDLSKIYQ